MAGVLFSVVVSLADVVGCGRGSHYSNNWPSSHTLWRRMKMGRDDQMRDIQAID
jgi:hypothetical protein